MPPVRAVEAAIVSSNGAAVGPVGQMMGGHGVMAPAWIIAISYLPGEVGYRDTDLLFRRAIDGEERIGGGGQYIRQTDRKHGVRIQIELRGGADPQRTMNELFKQTPLEETFGINNVVLVNGVPTTVGLYELCQHYITHRLDVIVRRTSYRLRRAQESDHEASNVPYLDLAEPAAVGRARRR